MQKMIGFLATVCVLNVIAILGLAGFLFASGRLDGAKVKVMADLARHQGTPEKLREKVGEMLDVKGPATAPGTQKSEGASTQSTADASEIHGPASAEERIKFARQLMEQERIQMDRQAQALRDQQKVLENLQRELTSDRQKFEAEKKAFEPKVAGADDKIKAENFQKMLALYDELKTKQVKDLFIDSKNADLVASYLVAMEPSRAGKIIGEFKTKDERDFIDGVLERIRLAGTTSAQGLRAGGDVAVAPKP